MLLRDRSWEEAVGKTVAAHVTLFPAGDVVVLGHAGMLRNADWVTRRKYVKRALTDVLRRGGKTVKGAEMLATGWRMLRFDPKEHRNVGRLIAEIEQAFEAYADTIGKAFVNPDIVAGLWHWQAFGEPSDRKARESDPFKPLPESESEDVPPIPDPWSADDYDEPPVVAVQVIKSSRVAKLPPEFRDLAGRPTPFSAARDPVGARQVLIAEFPYAAAAIEGLLAGIVEGRPLRMRPTLLLGEPGAGKSRLCRRFCEVIGLKIYRYDAAGSHDSMFSGSPTAWHNTQPATPSKAIARTRVANPCLFIDEIDKAGGSADRNGTVLDCLAPFLDPETAVAYPDTSLDLEINLAGICYLLTANTLSRLPDPLFDRLRVLRVPRPGIKDLPPLSKSVLRALAVESGDDPRWIQPLDGEELEIVGRTWSAGGMSIRRLQRILRATVEARAVCAIRH
ncbi:AAA family ATPase [Bradyrhizobium sp.]